MRDERVFLREILLSTEGSDAAGIAAVEKKAKDLVARARKGEKFPTWRETTPIRRPRKQGGDIGGFEKGKLRKDIEDQVWAKDKGFVTDPINIGNGLLILRVEDHQKAGQATFEEVEQEITDKMFMPKMQPAIREYLDQVAARKRSWKSRTGGWIRAPRLANRPRGWIPPS